LELRLQLAIDSSELVKTLVEGTLDYFVAQHGNVLVSGVDDLGNVCAGIDLLVVIACDILN